MERKVVCTLSFGLHVPSLYSHVMYLCSSNAANYDRIQTISSRIKVDLTHSQSSIFCK